MVGGGGLRSRGLDPRVPGSYARLGAVCVFAHVVVDECRSEVLIMPMSEDERRQLRDAEAELADQRQLAKLARRLGEASVDKGMGRTIALWAVGGSLGLILIVVGAVAHSVAAEAAGVVILIVTLLVVGVALIAVQVYGDLRERRLSQDRQPHSPSP